MSISEHVRSGISFIRGALTALLAPAPGCRAGEPGGAVDLPRDTCVDRPSERELSVASAQALSCEDTHAPRIRPGRRARATFTPGQASDLRQRLRKTPAADDPQRQLCKLEMIKLLRPAIATMRRRGYTLDEIAEFLTREGLPISAPSLGMYLHRTDGRRRARRRDRYSGLPLVLRPLPDDEGSDVPSAIDPADACPRSLDFDEPARSDDDDIHGDADPFGDPHET